MATEEYRQASYDTWQAMAEGWDRERAWMLGVTRPVAQWLVDGLEPQPGQTILELAAGTGDTGLLAARSLGPEGRLISTDFTPNMVEATRSEAERLGLENVECRQLDAERMDLPDGSVDGVLCRWGYMLMADPVAALAETRRVLRDGGRLSFSVWASAQANPWASIPGRAMMEHFDAPPPDPEAPGIFAMADPERTRALLAGAGFEPQRMEELELSWRFDNFDAYWGFVIELAGGIAMALRAVAEEDREAIRERVEAASEPFRDDGGYLFPGVAQSTLAV